MFKKIGMDGLTRTRQASLTLMSKRPFFSSVADKLENFAKEVEKMSRKNQDFIMHNAIMSPSFKGVNLSNEVFASSHPEITQILVVAGKTEAGIREKINQFCQSPKVKTILVVKGSNPKIINNDPDITNRYRLAIECIKSQGRKPGVVLNVHDKPSDVLEELDYKISLGAQSIFTQPLFSPYETIDKSILTSVEKIVKDGLDLRIGILPVTDEIYNYRKSFSTDLRTTNFGLDRYLVPKCDCEEDKIKAVADTIRYASELEKISYRKGQVDLYSRLGLKINGEKLEPIIERVRGTCFDYSGQKNKRI
jgi:hypothetical protein